VIYVIRHKSSPLTRLIEARSKAEAIRHVYGEQHHEPEIASKADLVEAIGKIDGIEKANGQGGQAKEA
jgi:hypothetical protein